MTALNLDGKAIAENVRSEVKECVAARIAEGKIAPGLATILVGENPASHIFVRSRHRACQEAGIISTGYELPATSTQKEVEALIEKLNQDETIHGILVQLPLPSGLMKRKS